MLLTPGENIHHSYREVFEKMMIGSAIKFCENQFLRN